MKDSEPVFAGAKCAGKEVDGFYPERGTAQITARDAKKTCNGQDGRPVCPAREACLEYALERKERFGIWGGKSERERAKIAKVRRVAAKKVELEIEQDRRRRAAAARKGWERRRSQLASTPPTPKQLLAQGLITRGEYDQMEQRVKATRTRSKGTRANVKDRRQAA